MFWDNLTKEEADEYSAIAKKIAEKIKYLELVRFYEKKKMPEMAENLPKPEFPTDPDFFRWNELWWKGWACK